MAVLFLEINISHIVARKILNDKGVLRQTCDAHFIHNVLAIRRRDAACITCVFAEFVGDDSADFIHAAVMWKWFERQDRVAFDLGNVALPHAHPILAFAGVAYEGLFANIAPLREGSGDGEREHFGWMVLIDHRRCGRIAIGGSSCGRHGIAADAEPVT